VERLCAIRLRYCINTHLDEQGITAAPDIVRAVGLPPAEAERRDRAMGKLSRAHDKPPHPR
jgi:hypothetical protein